MKTDIFTYDGSSDAGSVLLSLICGLLILPLCGCHGKTQSASCVTEAVADTVGPDSLSADTQGAVNAEGKVNHGIFITGDENVKVYADYFPLEEEVRNNDDIYSKDATCLVRYVDDVPVDTMILTGPYMKTLGRANLCKITVGVDTVEVDIRKPFDRTLDLRYVGALSGCRHHRLSKHYTLNKDSYPTDFQINVALPKGSSAYIVSFLSKMVRDDVAGFFGDYSGADVVYPDIPLYRGSDIPGMSRYYYDCFRRLYKKENGDSEEGRPWPGCSYQLYAYPVWKNGDSTLVTWKFYTYRYMGGAHGGETEFFLTFHTPTGRILGADDFFTEEEFRQMIDLLGRKLNLYHGVAAEGDGGHRAWLDEDSNVAAAGSLVLNEIKGKRKYPRPALTRQGIVFSYQTYEKGSNADGVLHFTLPYRKAL